MYRTKIGCNRGKPRVWLEGKVLSESGFKRGDKFSASFLPSHQLFLVLGKGDRTVSGKGDVPIIDIATSRLLEIGTIGTRLSIQRTAPGQLLIEPEGDECSVCRRNVQPGTYHDHPCE